MPTHNESAMARFMGRFKIGIRVYTGFALVLVLLAIVATIGYRGVRTGESVLQEYAVVADNVQKTSVVERDVASLRRSVFVYYTNGSTAHLAGSREIVKALDEDLTNLRKATIDPEVTGKIEGIHQNVRTYGSQFEEVVILRDHREKQFAETIGVSGGQIRANLQKIASVAKKNGDMDGAYAAGLAVDKLMGARVSAFRFLASPTQKIKAETETRIAELLQSATELVEALAVPASKELARDIVSLVGNYRDGFVEVANAAEKADGLVNGTMTQLGGNISNLAGEIMELQQESLAAMRTRANEAFDLAIELALVVAATAMALGVIFAWLIASGITKPVSAMTQAMATLADGNTEVDIPARGNRDEVGQMAKAVQVFKDNAIDKIRLEKEQEENERRAAEEKRRTMETMASNFEASVGQVVSQVSSAATEMQSSSESMSATAEETTRQAAAVAAASEQASANVQTVASAAEELTSSISEISRQVGQASEIAASAVREAEQTNAKIQGLAEAANKIGEVVALITDIADQTNLLALNATIEAARAGDAGKGFAVVASEVKNLANQTAKATDEIGTQISGIQTATKDAVAAIESITKTIAKIDEVNSSVASAVEEQGAATQEIARNVEQAAAGTQEVTTNITGVSQAANDTGAASEQIKGAANELSQQSEMLRSEVEKFLSSIRAA